MSWNPYQTAAKQAYGGGDFDHVRDMQEVGAVGDTLFLFVMRELATSEGCDSADEAIRRMEQAQADIQDVIYQIRKDWV